MTTRTAYYVQPKAGSLKNLKQVQETLNPPATGEVQVAVKTIGLNFADIFAVLGLYSATPKGAFVPGLEYAGEIIGVGEGVGNLTVGQKVMGVTRFGGYATHLNIDARYAIPLPENWSFEEGAAFLVQGLTAYYALFELGNLKAGQRVLIHSAAGGVGILANRMAKAAGAITIGTVGRESKVPFLNDEGVDHQIVRGKDFEQKLQESLGGQPLELILDCIGGKIFKIGFKTLAPMGRVVVFGSAHYARPGDRPNYFHLIWKYLRRPKIDPQQLPQINKSLLGFNLIYLYEQADLMHDLIGKIYALNIAAPHIGHTFAFDELPDALRLFLTGKTMGKVIVKV